MPKGKKLDTNSVPSDELETLRTENARLKEALRDSQQFIDVVVDAASEMFWRTDDKHRMVYMSPRVVSAVDIVMKEQLGKTRAELACDDLDSPRWQKHLADLDAHRPYENFRYTRKHVDGEIRHITSSGRPIFDDDGHFQGYIGTAEDISCQVKTEEKAKSAETLLMTAINSLEVIFAIWDSEDRLVVANEFFKTLNEDVFESSGIGSTFAEHLKVLAAHDLIGDVEDKDAWIESRQERHRNPQGPFEITRQNDTTILINEARLDDGSTILLSMDITEQKIIEDALRESQHRLLDFGTIAADWFWEMDADLRFSFMSADYTKNTPQLYIGKTRQELEMGNISKQDIEAHEQQLLRREPFSDLRYSRVKPDGSDFFVSIDGKPTFSLDGKFTGYRGVGRDITDLVMTERELRSQKEIAEEASRTKSEFLAHMSHELRTPLNAVLGFSDIIRQQSFGPVGNEAYVGYASDIHKSGELLLSLINDLLDLSKIEAGKFDLDEENLNLEEIIGQSHRLLENQLADRGINFKTQITSDYGQLYADRRAVTQILFNLLSNATKFNSDGGEISISVNLRDDNGIAIDVSDSGCGFKHDETDTALMPFGRIENPMTKETPGTGLGLPIVQALMTLHNGHLEIKSQIHVGTTITLQFPPERTIKKP